MSEWRSVKTPPDSAREVLVLTSDDMFWIASFSPRLGWWASSERGSNLSGATHWQELPLRPGPHERGRR